MVDGGGPITSTAIAKPLSQNAQPLQAPQIVRWRPRDGLGLPRKKWLSYIRDAIAYYGIDYNLIFTEISLYNICKSNNLKYSIFIFSSVIFSIYLFYTM